MGIEIGKDVNYPYPYPNPQFHYDGRIIKAADDGKFTVKDLEGKKMAKHIPRSDLKVKNERDNHGTVLNIICANIKLPLEIALKAIAVVDGDVKDYVDALLTRLTVSSEKDLKQIISHIVETGSSFQKMFAAADNNARINSQIFERLNISVKVFNDRDVVVPLALSYLGTKQATNAVDADLNPIISYLVEAGATIPEMFAAAKNVIRIIKLFFGRLKMTLMVGDSRKVLVSVGLVHLGTRQATEASDADMNQIISYLVEAGATIPEMFSAAKNDVRITKLLFEKLKMSLNDIDDRKVLVSVALVQLGMKLGDLKPIVSYLYETGASIQDMFDAANNDIRTIKLLFEKFRLPLRVGDDPKVLISVGLIHLGTTQAQSAADADLNQIISYLVDAGARNQEMFAAAKKNTRITKLLFAKLKTSLKEADDRNALLPVALVHLGAEQVAEAIHAGADVNARNANDESPVIIASNLGKRDAMMVLFKSGAILDAKTADGERVLFNSATQGWTKMVTALIDAGVELNEKFKQETALIAAARQGNATIVDALLKAGANAFESNDMGEDAISVAKTENLRSHIKECTGIKDPVKPIIHVVEKPVVQIVEKVIEKVVEKPVVQVVERVVHDRDPEPQHTSRVSADSVSRPSLSSDVGRAAVIGAASQVGQNLAQQFLGF